MDTTETLLGYATSLQYEDLPDEVVKGVKRIILNTFAAILAGSGVQGVKETASLVKQWGGKQESTVFFHSIKVPAHAAAFVNASAARALDFDEYNTQKEIHAGATIVPVALAIAEQCGKITGKELIVAIVVGSEIMSRMRRVPDFCIGVSGWTGEVYGGFGSAITSARIMRLKGIQIRHALGLAYSQAAGNAQSIFDGTSGTWLQQGFAARAGLVSAILAKRGVTGAHDFLEGRNGFYPVYYRGMKYDINRLLQDIGERYEFLNIATKPYPACGFTMGPIENIIDIMQSNNLGGEDIDKIIVRVNRRMYNMVCVPAETKYRPQTIADAMFSLPYVIATATLKGDVLLEDFSAIKIRNAERLHLADRVRMFVDENIEQESQKLNLSLTLHELKVETKDGQCFSRKMYHAKGSPQKPMTIEHLTEKIEKCAPYGAKPFPASAADELKKLVIGLEDLDDINSLSKLLT